VGVADPKLFSGRPPSGFVTVAEVPARTGAIATKFGLPPGERQSFLGSRRNQVPRKGEASREVLLRRGQ